MAVNERVVNVHEAKTHLSRLLDRVSAGEEIVLGKSGKPVARLVPYRESHEPRRPGRLKGKLKISEDFDATPPGIVALFEGEAESVDELPA